MKNKELEKLIRSDMSSMSPDVWDKIEQGIDNDSTRPLPDLVLQPNVGVQKTITSKKRVVFSVLALLLAGIIAISCILPSLIRHSGVPEINFGNTAYVYIDINPSVQLMVGSDGKVKDVKPLNNDATVLLVGKKPELIGKTSEQASLIIARLATELGYISVDKKNNAVLVSTQLADGSSSVAVQDSIKKQLLDSFKSQGIYGVVITDTNQTAVRVEAEKYGITESKMQLIIEAESFGVVFTKQEKTTIAISTIYERMAKRAEVLEQTGSYELSELLEEFEEQSEDALETVVEEIEELIEQLEDLLDDEDFESDSIEQSIEELEELLSNIEDYVHSNSELYKQLDAIYTKVAAISIGDEKIDKKISNIAAKIKIQIDECKKLLTEIENKKSEHISKQIELKKQNKDKNQNHKKDDNFDDDFEDWLENQQQLYMKNWNEYKTAWKNSFD